MLCLVSCLEFSFIICLVCSGLVTGSLPWVSVFWQELLQHTTGPLTRRYVQVHTLITISCILFYSLDYRTYHHLLYLELYSELWCKLIVFFSRKPFHMFVCVTFNIWLTYICLYKKSRQVQIFWKFLLTVFLVLGVIIHLYVLHFHTSWYTE